MILSSFNRSLFSARSCATSLRMRLSIDCCFLIRTWLSRSSFWRLSRLSINISFCSLRSRCPACLSLVTRESFFSAVSATFFRRFLSLSSCSIFLSFSSNFAFQSAGILSAPDPATAFSLSFIILALLSRSRSLSWAFESCSCNSTWISLYLFNLERATRSSSLTRCTLEEYSLSMESWSILSFWYSRCSLDIDVLSFWRSPITCIFSATRFLSLEISSYEFENWSSCDRSFFASRR
mmetsp:Transcript_1905/g.4364  ORF Transcript_1905/g.4364 Transcript_1905/m.4364 type:complete len:237 (-) Transcript_1905:251-961(-)